MNSLAYSPDPSFVPLLVGMYNGEIIVDDAAIERAKENNGFDNKTGALVISKDAVVDFVLKNQIGDLGLSVPHPVHPSCAMLTLVPHPRGRLLGYGWWKWRIHGRSLGSSSGDYDPP
jgi:hypothetical protein